MNQNIKWIARLIAKVTLVCFLPVWGHAQGVDPDVPIDGGLSILLAAGVGYGIKKVRDSRRKERKNPID